MNGDRINLDGEYYLRESFVREAIEKAKKQKFIMTKEAVYFIEKELDLKGE